MASSPDILYADSQDPGIAEVFIDMENVDHEEPVEEIADQADMVATFLTPTILPREGDDSSKKGSPSVAKTDESPSKSSSSISKSAGSSSNKTLKPIAPKITSPVSSGSSAKLLVPVQTALKTSRTPLKSVSGSNTSTVTTTATSTRTFLIAGGTGTSLIMLQPVLPQQAAPTATGSNQSQVQPSIVTPVPTKFNTMRNATSTTPIKQVALINSKQAISTPQKTNFVPIAPNPLTSQSALSASQILAGLSTPRNVQNGPKSENDPNRPRKPCNCTKSQCLKLYCECFANGEFCNACNCINCANNLKHEEERQKAIKQCLERNPHAFHPKIGKGRGDMMERRHTKGCNCRRSGCLKNYCECYEAKILCSELCKCISCKNYEDSFERKTLMHLADAAEVRSAQQSVASKAQLCGNDFRPKLPLILTDRIDRLHCAYITSDVIEATCECLLAQAENGLKNGLNSIELENFVLEEFGRCLRQIIDIANNTKLAKTGN